MNKSELAQALADQLEISYAQAYRTIDAFIETVSKTMCDGEPVRITGFGTFGPRARRSMRRFNPQTRQRITVPSKVVPSFSASSNLKETMRRKLKAVESGGEVSIVKAVK